MRKIITLYFSCIFGACVLAGMAFATANAKLLDIDVRSEMGNKAKVILKFSEPPVMPSNFSMDEPAKMVFDFSGVKNEISGSKLSQRPNLGVVKELNVVNTDEQTRLIMDVNNIVPFDTEVDGNIMTITLATDNVLMTKSVTEAEEKSKKTNKSALNDGLGDYINALDAAQKANKLAKVSGAVDSNSAVGTMNLGISKSSLRAIDFKRGDDGEGRIEIDLATVDMPVDFKEEQNDIIVEFKGATIAERFQRRFDVKDFGTPVQTFAVMQEKSKVIVKIKAVGDFEKIAYQLDSKYVIDIKPFSQLERELDKSRTLKFTGERISLNFQDIEVRAVLQLMADFTGLNIVASDSVTGHVTLRLENVPWDQALDFILKSKGLGKRESGNVLLIAPNEEIASREQLELESRKQAESLAQLRSEFIQINYAKASDIMNMLKEDKNSMLSARGVVTIDDRTNTLLIKDTEDKLADIKGLITKLDVPVRQVLIEAQVVQTKDNFEDALGLQFGGAFRKDLGKYGVGVGSDITKSRAIADAGAIAAGQNGVFFNAANSTSGPSGKMGISFARLPGGTLLDLELSASEFEDKSKILAKPKLITLDQQTASIESGNEIAYSVTGQNGATPTTTFKKAVLKLEVTPQITPNDKVLMELNVNQDRPGNEINGQASISTTSLTTNILVDNGETIVLGGIYNINQGTTNKRVPFFSDIPIIGKMFDSYKTVDLRDEVLIFVTPKIIKAAFDK